MRGLTFQHVPEPLRNAALRYTSSIELLDEIIQESPEHRHNARVNSSIRRVERDRDNDRDNDNNRDNDRYNESSVCVNSILIDFVCL